MCIATSEEILPAQISRAYDVVFRAEKGNRMNNFMRKKRGEEEEAEEENKTKREEEDEEEKGRWK